MIDNQQFADIKAGQYVKTQYRNEKRVRKVSKVTKTQIVITEWGYGIEPSTDRFRISNGCRIGDSWYHMHQLISDPVSSEEAADYEARMAKGERFRKERTRLIEIESRAKAKLIALFAGNIADENIKVQSSSSDGLKTVTFKIECDKLSEQSLLAALSLEPTA